MCWMQKQPKKQSALNFDGKEIIQENSILYLFSLKNTLQHKLQLLLFITYKMIQYFWCQSLFLLTHTHTFNFTIHWVHRKSANWFSYSLFYSINCIVNQNNGQTRNIFHSAIIDTHWENWDQLYLFEWVVNGVYAINIIQTLASCECCVVWATLKT